MGAWLVDTNTDYATEPPARLIVHPDGTLLQVDQTTVAVGVWQPTGDDTAALTITAQVDVGDGQRRDGDGARRGHARARRRRLDRRGHRRAGRRGRQRTPVSWGRSPRPRPESSWNRWPRRRHRAPDQLTPNHRTGRNERCAPPRSGGHRRGAHHPVRRRGARPRAPMPRDGPRHRRGCRRHGSSAR